MDILIENGVAHELFPEGAPEVAPEFAANIVYNYVGEVECGWEWNGTAFVAPSSFEDTRTYAEKRADEYPPVAEYLDGIVKNDTDQIQEYINKCLAIKEKYPKV